VLAGVELICASCWFVCALASAAPTRAAPSLGVGDVVSTAALRDAGSQNALAAVESYLRTAAGGNVGDLSDMMRWTWRENAYRLFAGLPSALTEKYASPEQLVSAAESVAISAARRVQIFQRLVVSESEEILAVRTFRADGNSAEHLFWMRWSGSQWLRVETSTIISRLGRQVAEGQIPDATESVSFAEQYAWIVPQTGPKPALSTLSHPANGSAGDTAGRRR
jgi:hypothetical protein